MSRIPSVRTYRVSVLNDLRECEEIVFVNAPTRQLAILNARFEFPRLFGKSIVVLRLASRFSVSADAADYHFAAAKRAALAAKRKLENACKSSHEFLPYHATMGPRCPECGFVLDV